VLRPYQLALLAETRAAMMAGTRSLLITSPTGSGKTMLTVHMLREAALKGKRCWFIVHRRELLKQSLLAFSSQGVKAGVIGAGWLAEPKHAIQVCGIGALPNRMRHYQPPDLVVWDESHHCNAKSWATVKRQLSGAYHVGLTATPERLDGKGLGEHFSKIIHGPSVKELIADGFLSPYRLYSTPGIDTRGLRSVAGDYSKKQLGLVADKPTITGDAVNHYVRLAGGKQAVVFAVSIEHSKHIVAQFQAQGISALHIDGETSATERDRGMERFKSRGVQVLCNVDLFGEGVDVPGIECAILLRPTQSLGLYLQQVGRALRTAPGKTEAIILDHAGNAGRHGLPDDARGWNLAGHAGGTKRDQEQKIHVRICPKCFAAQAPGPSVCQFCGTAFNKTPREIQQAEGELQEVIRMAAKVAARKEVGRARTESELVALGQSRGYKNPQWWAQSILAARGFK
jgi:superfamily II DNA or RNA helicase